MYRDIIAITNRALVEGDFILQIQKVVKSHPYGLILREKDLNDEEYRVLAERIMKLCDEEQVKCFVHSRMELAVSIQCPNIHFSIQGLRMAKEEKRDLNAFFQEISVSCHSLKDVEEASALGATQIVLGTIFETDCKKGLKGKGVGFVKEICKSTSLPVFAIGGITVDRLPMIKAAGAKGGCMMSGLMKMK